MNSARIILPMLFLSLLPAESWCQDAEELPERPVRFQGVYVTIMHTAISNVPLSHKTDRYGSPIWEQSIRRRPLTRQRFGGLSLTSRSDGSKLGWIQKSPRGIGRSYWLQQKH